MTGIVTLPEPTVLATELPEYIPSRALEMTATLAGPPVAHPAIELAMSMKKVPMLVFSKNEAKIINKTIKVEHTPIGVPITPSRV